MLGQRRRRWPNIKRALGQPQLGLRRCPNIKPALGQRLVSVGLVLLVHCPECTGNHLDQIR